MVPPGELIWTMTAAVFEFRQPVERLDAILVAADQAFDVDARDRARRREATAPRRHRKPDHGNRRDRDDGGRDAPERQLAPYPAAIDDQIGIKRHRKISRKSLANEAVRFVSAS